jgi:hypothetical protein
LAGSYLAAAMTTFRSNCLVWAVRQWMREGGYIAARRSRHWRFVPHVLWSADLVTWLGFAPLDPRRGFLVLFYCWWFLGRVEQEAPRNPPS